MKTAVAADDDEPYDWVDDPNLTLPETMARFEQLRSTTVTVCAPSPALNLTLE